MDQKIFEELGFTNAETKVYLALLKIGMTTAGPLLIETKLQNSTLHKTLHSLVSKGFASFTIKGKTHYYKSADPETILKFVQEKETKFKSMMPELKFMQKPLERQEAEVYEGFNGFKTMLQELISDAKKGDEFLFFTFDNPKYNEVVYNYYQTEYQKDREKKGMVVKGIVPRNKSNLVGPGDNKKRFIKYVNFPVPFNISIANDKVIFTPWEDRQISFLVHSRQLAESFRQLFYSIYNK